MATMEQVKSHLKEKHFLDAVTAAFELLKDESPGYEAAWEDLISGPATHTLNIQHTTIKSSPFLLGCAQAVYLAKKNINEDSNILEQWEAELKSPPVFDLLQRGTPLRDYFMARAAIACAKTANASMRGNADLLLRHAVGSAHWINSLTPKDDLKIDGLAAPTIADEFAIESSYQVIKERFDLPVGYARDLAKWFLLVLQTPSSKMMEPTDRSTLPTRETTRGHETALIRRVRVPFYIERAEKGSISTLEIEFRKGTGEFYPDPIVMGFVHFDEKFQASYQNARDFVQKTLGFRKDDADVCWRIISDPPLPLLSGDSAGGGFFTALCHLLRGDLNDLSVAITAAIRSDGSLWQVDKILPKLDALSQLSDISDVVVAHNQDSVGSTHGRLKIHKCAYAADPKAHAYKPPEEIKTA